VTAFVAAGLKYGQDFNERTLWMMASPKMQSPLLNTTKAAVPYQNQGAPLAFTVPASMAMLNPAPTKISPSGACISHLVLAFIVLFIDYCQLFIVHWFTKKV
jgi:hypothetical protein